MMFTLGHNNMLNAISKEEVVERVAADLTAEVREQGLGVTADAGDELHISLLSARLLPMRDKQLGASLAADEEAVVAITTAGRDTPRTTDVEVCDLPRLEKGQRSLVVSALGHAATATLGCQADRASLAIGLKKPGWQVSTNYFTMTLEFEDALEINVTKLLMNSLNVLGQSGILEQCADSGCRALCVLVSILSISRRAHLDVGEHPLAGRRRHRGGGRSE